MRFHKNKLNENDLEAISGVVDTTLISKSKDASLKVIVQSTAHTCHMARICQVCGGKAIVRPCHCEVYVPMGPNINGLKKLDLDLMMICDECAYKAHKGIRLPWCVERSSSSHVSSLFKGQFRDFKK